MKNLLLTGTILAVLTASSARAQTRPTHDNNSFLLRLAQPVDTTDLSIRYFIAGAFGGYYNFIRTKPNIWEYAIDTSYEGTPAESLKAIVYCPGYGIELLDVPSLANSSSHSATITLNPLPTFRLLGMVKLPEGHSIKNFNIEVVYVACWSLGFYGIRDGIAVSLKVASTPVSQDGSFSILIPDFASDPIINSFKENGMLRLQIREQETGNTAYELERDRQIDMGAEIRIGERFSDELILNAKPIKKRYLINDSTRRAITEPLVFKVGIAPLNRSVRWRKPESIYPH